MDVTWDKSSHKTKATGSDNWPTTWADDGHQYTSWGDGGGFGGTNSTGRVSLGVARVEGSATSYKGFNVWGGKSPENPKQFNGKSYGLLSVNGVLYMWLMRQEDGKKLYEESQITWSNNHGASFKRGFLFAEPDAGFASPTFLNFGKDYQGARDNFVYTYSGQPLDGCKGSSAKCIGNDVHLARVPKEEITNRNSYEFFEGLDSVGNPKWTTDITKRRPVFSDSNGATVRLGVIYNAGIGRYLMSISHRNSGGLGIFDAPEPWGPWTTVAYYDDWLNFGYSPSYHIASQKWMSSDGKDFTMVWSSSDRWNTLRGHLELSSSDTVSPAAPSGLKFGAP